MADVSQLTGIPADRIYKWEKGTKPNDAEDLLKIREYLEGKLESLPDDGLEKVPKNPADPTPMEILKVLAEAFRDQAKAFADQAAMMKNIESKMALETSLQETLAGVETIYDQHGPKLKKIQEDLEKLMRRKTVP
jgi:transcriptional regulator with XRE-family HTH domain